MRADSEQASSGYRDVTCSFCDRHNSAVHMVGGRDGLTICAVCVARCAEILDRDTGLAGPEGGWSDRWPAKQLK
jgi:ClpX C4-type zinc finger